MNKSRTFLSLLAASLLMLSSCQSHDDEVAPAAEDNYINLTLTVSDGNDRTRGPEGGKAGDGRETGFADENQVTGVTLILYQGDIQAAATTPIDFVTYYPTISAVSQLSEGQDEDIEAVYTTGNQSLKGTGIDITKKYHAIVIANVNLTSAFKAGVTTLGEVRDYSNFPQLFTGSGKGGAATNFVMTSETDKELDFGAATPTDIAEGKLYTFGEIRIERMAARIDFWVGKSAGMGEYADGDGVKNYKMPGYRYDIDGTTDKFILTKVTPFNLYTGDEYLIRRIQNSWSAGFTTTYLGDEGTTGWVIDPQTANKDNTTALTYDCKLSEVVLNTEIDYSLSASEMEAATTKSLTFASGKSIVLAYTRENTLKPTSHLYKYATGICLQGDIYPGGDASKTPVTIRVYGYLRHQGESSGSSYYITEAPVDGIACGTAVAMNYGIVRNNIYRVSIDHITDKGTIFLGIKVKKWDEYLHEYIYM